MELWIRNQKSDFVDERLIKVNDIALEYVEDGTYCIVVNNGVEVAYYHSEKRALEVLDEIQELDTNKKNIIVSLHFDKITKITYIMPQEREDK